MNDLQVWQQLQTTWSQAFLAAKAAESQLNVQVTRFLQSELQNEHQDEQPSCLDSVDMNKMMELWLLASQSLTAMDEFVYAHLQLQKA